jgi:hypothetical protein
VLRVVEAGVVGVAEVARARRNVPRMSVTPPARQHCSSSSASSASRDWQLSGSRRAIAGASIATSAEWVRQSGQAIGSGGPRRGA